MRPWLVLFPLLAACPAGTMEIVGFIPPGDDDSAVGDDDDAVGDDDVVGDDDDVVGDDDDVVGDDDDQPTGPKVDCGPYEPTEDGRIWNGEATLQADSAGVWQWRGCEVERWFNDDGELRCEALFEVEGEMFATQGEVARYWLEFRYDADASWCAEDGDFGDAEWMYRIDWGQQDDVMEIRYGEEQWTDLERLEFWAWAPWTWDDGDERVDLAYTTETWPW